MTFCNFIPHSEISEPQLAEVISIKSIAWPHSRESQTRWLKDNLNANDIHVLLYQNHEIVAYLNLVKIRVEVGSEVSDAWGLGNVCAVRRKSGFGQRLLAEANEYLRNNNRIGLLFCKSPLVPFYQKNDWHLLDDKSWSLPVSTDDIFAMAYNAPDNFLDLHYSGRLF